MQKRLKRDQCVYVDSASITLSTRLDRSGGFSCATKSPAPLLSHFSGSVSFSTKTTLQHHTATSYALSCREQQSSTAQHTSML